MSPQPAIVTLSQCDSSEFRDTASKSLTDLDAVLLMWSFPLAWSMKSRLFRLGSFRISSDSHEMKGQQKEFER